MLPQEIISRLRHWAGDHIKTRQARAPVREHLNRHALIWNSKVRTKFQVPHTVLVSPWPESVSMKQNN